MRRVFTLVAAGALALAASLAGARAADEKLVRVFDARTPMGTYMAVTVYAPDEAAGQRAIQAAFDRVEKVEAATSTYRETSDISKLNRSAGGPALPVSKDLWQATCRALEVARETGGAFDPTVGPLVELWRRTWKQGKAPSDAEVAAAKALVDYRAVRCVPDALRVQLTKPGMRLELSGIAKGYAVDQAIAAIREQGINAALVDAGGDIYAMGSPPGRDGWFIGVRDPEHPGKILPAPLRLRDQSVATSGDYEQFGVISGHRYSHILDPRTGRPVEGMTSVTVVAPDATTADAYATAVSVLGVEGGLALAGKHPGVEIMILRAHDGKVTTSRSSGFSRLEVTSTGPH